MNELITIQVGQCGNQIGSNFWPLALQEYGVKNVPHTLSKRTRKGTKNPDFNDSFHSFLSSSEKFDFYNIQNYSDLKKYHVKARAVLVDMEDSVVNRYHNGPLRDLFDKSNSIINYPGSGNNFAEGYFEHGRNYKSKIDQVIRSNVEKCNNLNGFNLLYSVGGGTGSGLGSYILEMLEEYYPNIDRFVTCVYPNGSEDVITCPYNMTLATKWLTECANCVFPVENRALEEIIKRQFQQNYSESKAYDDYNGIIVNMLLHLTSRKIHSDIFTECCSRKHQLLMLDPLGLNSTLLSSCLIGRGTYTMSDLRKCVDYIQKRVKFTNWSQKSVKIGLCKTSSIGHEASMLILFNTTAVVDLFIDIVGQFNKLYHRKAHIHHYTKIPGFEMDLFEECRENLLKNIENYKSLTQTKTCMKPRIKYL